MTTPTKQLLGEALAGLGLDAMAEQARAGHYDDFESESPTPATLLYCDLIAAAQISEGATAVAINALAAEVQRGAFSSTKEEADAWAVKEGIDFAKIEADLTAGGLDLPKLAHNLNTWATLASPDADKRRN